MITNIWMYNIHVGFFQTVLIMVSSLYVEIKDELSLELKKGQ